MILNVHGVDVSIDDKTMNRLENLGCPVTSELLEMYLRQDGITPNYATEEQVKEKSVELVEKELQMAEKLENNLL